MRYGNTSLLFLVENVSPPPKADVVFSTKKKNREVLHKITKLISSPYKLH
jgi:hypothetical protein